MRDYLNCVPSLPCCKACGEMVFNCFCETADELEDSYICDCELNYGKRCKHPSKYRTTGCDGK